MEVSWSLPLGPDLLPEREERLFELYHENSKLSAGLADDPADGVVSPFDVYLASRGFKQFRAAPRVALPDAGREPVNRLTSTLRTRRSARSLEGALPLAVLAEVLGDALEPTAVVRSEELGVEQALRAWPSAGGLYPLDVYVVAASVDDVDPGVYHHNVLLHALERIPARPPAEVLRDGFFWQEFLVAAAAVIVLVAVFDRTVAKYGERGYRLVLLDAGHAAQNVLLKCEDAGVPAVAVGGFADDSLAADLGLDGTSEAVVHTVALGGAG